MIINNVKIAFAQVPNEAITDAELSSGAFRLLAYLYSLPNEWSINNTDIKSKLGINDDKTIAKYWKEVTEAGWCVKERGRDSGRYNSDGITLVLNGCKEKNTENNLIGDNTQLGENGDLINTNKNSNTNKNINTNKEKKEKEKKEFFDEKTIQQVKVEKYERTNKPFLNVHEEIPDGVLTEDENKQRFDVMLDAFFSSSVWFETFCITNKISSNTAKPILRKYFVDEIQLKGNHNRTLKWVRSRFINWYNENYKKQEAPFRR
ncbi:MAG: hypothetical protein RBT65_14785 [Methanolobus sp.]|nr:hypothetical protein [Methanolobus sp.]